MTEDFQIIREMGREIEELRASLSAAEKELGELREEVGKALPVQWTKGGPPFPFCDEWFIAITVHGDKVVLRSLPKEYSYDYTTADGTYMKRENVKAWMQFPGSEYVSFALRALTQERDTALRERDEARSALEIRLAETAPWVERTEKFIAELQDKLYERDSILTSIKTALGCPDLPVEEIVAEVYALHTFVLSCAGEKVGYGHMGYGTPTALASRAQGVLDAIAKKAEGHTP